MTGLYLIGNEEREIKFLLVFQSAGILWELLGIFFVKQEELRVQDLLVIVHNYPEGLVFAVPSVVPLEIWFYRQHYLEDGPSDWLAVDLHL